MTTTRKIERIKAIRHQRTTSGKQYVAHVVTADGEHASLQSPKLGVLKRRLRDSGATDEQIAVAVAAPSDESLLICPTCQGDPSLNCPDCAGRGADLLEADELATTSHSTRREF